MPAVALSGDDTIQINNRVFTDLADGNVVELTFPTDIAQAKTGKNGNSVYALNETGKQADMKIRVLRGSKDDQFLLNLLNQQIANFAGTVLMIGQFVKQIGDGQGNILADTYVTSGGIFKKQVEGKSNVEGEVDQSVAEYNIKWTNAPRVIS